ncbi:O-antigen ligase family protein [Roseisalinus antarcticus]|uniref:O-Antigen ligase n=1 Tax=Roseisalinus antarcticus TaxID=254357 RepID=A0A1Y5TN89_9RHOB|nr:O-antigen ligase family protein [Roseisalinus antarcticus]SLN64335.1 O-Antigen ligase [Roseisalinus antarcticus]
MSSRVALQSAAAPSYASVHIFAFRCLLLSFATLFVVVIEPAPSDLFFAIGFFALMATGTIYASERLTAFYWLVFLFLALNVLSLLLANVFAFGLKYFLITLYLLLIPVLMVHFVVLYGRRGLDWMYAAFFLGAAISAVIGALALMRLAPGPVTLYFRAEDGLRLSPLFKDPNVYGPYMAAAGFLLLGRLLCTGARARLQRLALVGFILSMMFLTFSRGAWLNGAIVIFVSCLGLALFSRAWQQRKWFLILLTGGTAFLLLAGPLLLEALNLKEFFSQRSQLQAYDTDRFTNWARAIDVITREPLGIGPGHYVGQNHFPQSEFDLATHNLYLKVTVENGWLGLVCFLLAIAVVLVGLSRTWTQRDGREPIRIAVFAVVIGQLVNSVVVDSLHWRHFFVVLGFACCEIALAAQWRAARRSAPPS